MQTHLVLVTFLTGKPTVNWQQQEQQKKLERKNMQYESERRPTELS